VRVYGRAAREGAPVRVLPLRTNAPLVTSMEYSGQFLNNERRALLIAYNEPALAGWAPERTIARFDWSTPLPRYWNWPLWLPRFQRARYLFPSESEGEDFLRQHGRIPNDRVTVLPNAVDLQAFRPFNHTPAAVARVGFAGQWAPRKGIGTLLQAWALVRAENPLAELVLAGGPGLWKATAENAEAGACAEQVKQMEGRGLVRVAGAVTRAAMPRFWNSLKLAVVPSLYEPFGLVALEAMACGVPVVASSVGGLKEIVTDGESGILIPPGKPEALAGAIRYLLNNETLRLRLAAGARRRAEAFSLERRSAAFLSLLRERMRKAA